MFPSQPLGIRPLGLQHRRLLRAPLNWGRAQAPLPTPTTTRRTSDQRTTWPTNVGTSQPPPPRQQDQLQNQVNQLESTVRRLEALLTKLTEVQVPQQNAQQPPPPVQDARNLEGGGTGSMQGAAETQNGRERSPRRAGTVPAS